MNTTIRAVIRSAIYNGFAVKAVIAVREGLVLPIVSFKSQA